MKKLLRNILILTSIDQIIKIIVTKYFIGRELVLIPNFLYFEPVQNTYLNWIASMNKYETKVSTIIIIGLSMLVFAILIHRYLLYLRSIARLETKLVNTYGTIVFSGIICALIDTIFWGGSWDYIGIKGFFIFDLKDIYLTMSYLLVILFVIKYYNVIRRIEKSERINDGVIYWIKSGMPTVHKDL